MEIGISNLDEPYSTASLVSIIINNSADFFSWAIDSALNQAYLTGGGYWMMVPLTTRKNYHQLQERIIMILEGKQVGQASALNAVCSNHGGDSYFFRCWR